MAEQETKAQHYVTQGYLRGWTAPDKKLWETTFDGPELVERRVKTKETGCRDYTYATQFGMPDIITEPPRDLIETTVFNRIDREGADVLQTMRAGVPIYKLSRTKKKNWARFLVAQRLRCPYLLDDHKAAALGRAQEAIDAFRARSETPESKEIFDLVVGGLRNNDVFARATVTGAMAHLIRSPALTQDLMKLTWATATVPTGEPFELITSDRPLLVNGGENGAPIRFLSIAVSPKLLFAAFDERLARSNQGAMAHIAETHNVLLLTVGAQSVYSKSRISEAFPLLWEYVTANLRRGS